MILIMFWSTYRPIWEMNIRQNWLTVTIVKVGIYLFNREQFCVVNTVLRVGWVSNSTHFYWVNIHWSAFQICLLVWRINFYSFTDNLKEVATNTICVLRSWKYILAQLFFKAKNLTVKVVLNKKNKVEIV